jgi:ATP/maltotriose-dependent transcriptional regulator MalT
MGTTPGERRVLAAAATNICLTGSAPASDALALARQFGSAGVTFTDSNEGDETTGAVGTVTLLCDHPGPSIYHELWDETASSGRILQAAFIRVAASQVGYRRGALFDAEADARAGWEMFAPFGGAPTTMYWWSLTPLIQILIVRGLLDEATALVKSTGLARAKLDTVIFPWPSIVRGELALAQGRTEEGIDLLLDAGTWLEERGFTNPSFTPWRALVAPALAARGRVEEARDLIATAIDRARMFGAPWGLGMALRAAGTIEQGASGVELLGEALEVLEPSPCRVEHAHALLELGAALRRTRQRAKAREHLRAALDMSYRCGASPLATRAGHELAATGARPRRVMLSGLESLTASERRVAELATSGLSNPEIAQHLFVTRKTVETHLGHVYLKLDISSRQQLPAALSAGARSDAAGAIARGVA